MFRDLKLRTLIDGQFEIKHNHKRRHALIYPAKGKERWYKEELWFRSTIINREGHVISTGFPKFFNLSEHLDGRAPALPFGFEMTVERLAGYYDISFYEKADGTLIIRDVINGKVNFRTRGTFEFTEPREHVREWQALCKAYPRLVDPNWLPYHSALFEFVSPRNKIVTKYDESQAIFLGSIDPRYGWFTPSELLDTEFPIPRKVEFIGTLEEIQAQVYQMEDTEGFVGYFHSLCSSPSFFIKFKTKSYLEMHRAKSHWNAKRVGYIACISGADTNNVDSILEGFGIDAEIFDAVSDGFLPGFQEYRKFVEYVEGAKELLLKDVFLAMDRKQFATWVKNNIKTDYRHIYFSLYRREDKWNDITKMILEKKAYSLFSVPENEIEALKGFVDADRSEG